MATLKEICDDAVSSRAIAHLARIPEEVKEKYAHLDILNSGKVSLFQPTPE